jgi:hypothetical protein
MACNSAWRSSLMGPPHVGSGGSGVLVGSSVLMAGGSLHRRHCLIVTAHDSRAVKREARHSWIVVATGGGVY